MKRLTILLILIVGVIMVSNAQCNLPYKALSAFGNDTTAFMKYNFKDRTDCYKGKTVNQVLSDLSRSNISIIHYTYGLEKNLKTNGITMIMDIDIYIYSRKLVLDKLYTRIKKKKDKLNSITIFFETPIRYADVRDMLVNDKEEPWNSTVREFFSKQKIKEIKFSD